MKCARCQSSLHPEEEIFGPVLSVIPADDENDAVRIAYDTIDGLLPGPSHWPAWRAGA